MNTHLYKHMYTRPISMSTSKKWADLILILRFMKNASLSMMTSSITKRIISHKYNIYVKSEI
jgi:hypothetical protein